MKLYGRVTGSIGSAITIGFGVWHFFIPSIWNWYSHFSTGGEELILAVRAINFFFSFSLVLFGALCLIFLWHQSEQVFYLKALLIGMMLLWGLRVIMQIVYPQGSASTLLQFGMLGVFVLTLVLYSISAFSLRSKKR